MTQKKGPGDRRRGIRRVFDVFAALAEKQRRDIRRDLDDRRRTPRRASDDAADSTSSAHVRHGISSAPADSVRPTVLVVDDVDATRAGLAELLRLRGYSAVQATNGAEGLRMLQDHPHIRTIILDLQMPGFDGFWFRERQLKDSVLSRIPVIVFTAFPEVGQLAAQLQLSEVLTKPVSVDRLFEAVQRHCGG